jgi:hypothetical protein
MWKWAVVVVIVLLVLWLLAPVAEKLKVMTINIGAGNKEKFNLQNVMYGSSPDPRFNLMAAAPAMNTKPGAGIIALGQRGAEWLTWRAPGLGEHYLSQYGPNVGSNRTKVSQLSDRERMENANVFRGPPGYDITIVRENTEENLQNKIAWEAIGSQDKRGDGHARDAQLVASLFSM